MQIRPELGNSVEYLTVYFTGQDLTDFRRLSANSRFSFRLPTYRREVSPERPRREFSDPLGRFLRPFELQMLPVTRPWRQRRAAWVWRPPEEPSYCTLSVPRLCRGWRCVTRHVPPCTAPLHCTCRVQPLQSGRPGLNPRPAQSARSPPPARLTFRHARIGLL